MAASGRGGYRKPANPAMVSGPGAHSQRTDGQPQMALPNAQYGEGAAFAEAQSGAALATDPSSAGGGGSATPPPSFPASFEGLGDPTSQPDTHVTDGAEYGAGAGPEAIAADRPDRQDAQFLQKYLPTLIDIAGRDETPPGFKSFVRSIIANG